MTTRGMTLLETLASLSLLGLLMAASLGWITASQRSLRDTAAMTNWRRAADMTLAQLHDDLVSGETDAWAAPIRLGQPFDHALEPIESFTFRTRVSGQGIEEVSYRFDADAATLTRATEESEWVLLGSLASVQGRSIHPENDPDLPPTAIELVLESLGGQTTARTVPLLARGIDR